MFRDQRWDPKTVDAGGRCSKVTFATNTQNRIRNSGRCLQVVINCWWSLKQFLFYCQNLPKISPRDIEVKIYFV